MTYPRARIIGITLLIFSSLLGVIPALASVTQLNSKNATLPSQNSSLTEDFLYYTISNTSLISAPTNGFQCFLDMDSKYSLFGSLVMPFKLFYDCIFVASVIIITILYILIYKEIYTRRKLKETDVGNLCIIVL